MRRSLAGIAILAVVAGLLYYAAGRREVELHQREFFVMGTLVSITIADTDRATALRAMEAAEEDFRYMDRTWNPWKPSALRRINQLLASTEWFSVAPSVEPLIRDSMELYERSGGLFNPAIGGLVALWGFNRDEPPTTPPPREAIGDLVARAPSMADIEFDGIRIRSRNAAVQLDFGAFAKGRAVRIVTDLLLEMGIRNAIVNAGGDLRAIGRRGDRPWRIAIRRPSGEGYLAVLETRGDESIFTSGDYERWFEYQGRRYHHILDPRTGYPAEGVSSVTVVHGDAGLADAAATALFVAGPEKWPEAARAMGVEQVMVVGSDGTVYMTPAMAERIRFEEEPPRVVIRSP